MTYASKTEVPVSRSQAEVQKMLLELGAERLAIIHMEYGVELVFRIRGTSYRITAPDLPPARDTQAARQQGERSSWRALVLLVKAKKVAIDQNITTIEREFMADTVMPDGSTLIEHHAAIVTHNYKHDGPPLLGFDR